MTKNQVIDYIGGKGPGRLARTARRLGISIQAVHQWPDPPPPKWIVWVLEDARKRGLPAPGFDR